MTSSVYMASTPTTQSIVVISVLCADAAALTAHSVRVSTDVVRQTGRVQAALEV